MKPTQNFLILFRDIQTKFSRIYASILCRSDLTLPQFALLSHLVFQGTKSMTEASRELHVTKPAVTYLTDLLEKKKFIKRTASSGDRRIHKLEVTARGTAAVERVQKLVLGFLFDSLDSFNVKEKEVVFAFYEELAEKVNLFLEKEKV